MSQNNKSADNSKLDRVVAEARNKRDEREKGYRERANLMVRGFYRDTLF